MAPSRELDRRPLSFPEGAFLAIMMLAQKTLGCVDAELMWERLVHILVILHCIGFPDLSTLKNSSVRLS